MSNLYKFPLAYTDTPYGPFIYLPTDEFVGRSLDKYGWYSPSECKFLTRLVKPGMRVANIGAQMGYMARVFASQGCRTYAFEPQPGMCDITKANSAALPKYDVFPIALGNECKSVNIPYLDYSKPNNYGAVSSAHWTSGKEIWQMSLDNNNLNLEFDLIQIDAEGMEKDILEGGTKLIERTRPILFLENDRPNIGTELIKYVESIRYTPYWLVTPLFEKNNPAGDTENIFENIVTFNMVCFPQEKTHEMEDWCAKNLRVATISDKIGEVKDWVELSNA